MAQARDTARFVALGKVPRQVHSLTGFVGLIVLPCNVLRSNAFIHSEEDGMHDFLGVLAFIAAWILVSRWLLPRFGVQT
jgi:hypothetical protein